MENLTLKRWAVTYCGYFEFYVFAHNRYEAFDEIARLKGQAWADLESVETEQTC